MQADLAQRAGASAEELKKSLEQIGRSSMRATHTVNQLLSLARAESTGAVIPTQACDLVALTLEVVQDSLPRAMDRSIDLGYEGPDVGTRTAWTIGHPTLLKELIRNLVDNAINYTPSSTAKPGVVTARVLPQADGQSVWLQVEDSGPGIAPGERELVFQPFYRALGNEADGSGLGLPIVMEIAAKHGAKVTIEYAHPNQTSPGALFTVCFSSARP
jgi:two-component system sensor histidine kinase TctE